ncbi:hypothetical protein DM02DRAFT_626054 [Periconia macrospinosa]|uniref:Uncharacterized protein n=1 Tax=Periconia macrospinosa TaxID=97972 RepID=A0A2V1E0M3_9PLEO|nr:hypothetical protein DM02DRAFT_626054 [Periconia macrospinosa]
MVRLFSTRKESASAESDSPMSTTVDLTDAAESERKDRSLFQRIFSRSSSPRKISAGKRPAATEDPEPYYYEEDNDIMAFKTPLNPVPEAQVEAEPSKRSDAPGFTAYYLRFDPARGSHPPPALPPLDRALSIIPEVDNSSMCDPGPSSPFRPEPLAPTNYSNRECSSCGLHYLECAKTIIPSGAKPSKGLNINIHIDEIDSVRLVNHVRKRTKNASHDTGEEDTHILMYLNHRYESTDKRVEIRIGFDRDVSHKERTVVAFLCEFKKSQIISYLGPHAAKLWCSSTATELSLSLDIRTCAMVMLPPTAVHPTFGFFHREIVRSISKT